MMSFFLKAVFYCVMLSGLAITAFAETGTFVFENELQEKRFQSLTLELRCPKCQNQSLADSDSEIAQDLKQRVYELLLQGKSDDEIRNYLIERYGDFISYRPPMKLATVTLWFGPAFIFILALGLAYWKVSHGRKTKGSKADKSSDDFLSSARLVELRHQLESIEQPKQVAKQTGLQFDFQSKLKGETKDA